MAYQKKTVQLKMDGGVTSDLDFAQNNGRFSAIRGLRQDIYPSLHHNRYQKYGGNNLTPSTMIAGWDWWPDAVSTTHRTIGFFSDGTIRKDTYGSGTWSTTLSTGLPITGAAFQFVEGGKEAAANNRKLFIFYTQNAGPYYLSGDGAVFLSFISYPADWAAAGNKPTCGAIHAGRLWAAGNANDAHRLYYSTTAEQSDFTGAGSGTLSVFPGEGQKIVAMASYKGLLIVWKYPLGVYYVDTTDPTITNWKVKRISSAVGGISPNGWAAVENDLVFLSAQNDLFSLSAVQAFGDVLPRSLTQMAGASDYISNNIIPFGTSQSTAAQLVYYAPRRELQILIPGGTNVNLRADFNQQIVRFGQAEYGGTSNAAIWLGFQNNLDPIFLTGGITTVRAFGKFSGLESNLANDLVCNFTSAPMNLSELDPSLGVKRKSDAYLELHFQAEAADYTVTVGFLWDAGKNNIAGSYTQNVVVKAATGASYLRMYRLRIPGGGKYLQWSVSGVTGPFHLQAAFLSFTINDERIFNF